MQNWRAHPDPHFVPDTENAFVRSAGRRRWVTAYEILRLFASTFGVLVLLVVLTLVVVVLGVESWLAFLFIAGAMLLVVWLLSRLAVLRKSPLRCSGCTRLMERHEDASHAGDCALYYVCPHCKKYVDTGISSGG